MIEGREKPTPAWFEIEANQPAFAYLENVRLWLTE